MFRLPFRFGYLTGLLLALLLGFYLIQLWQPRNQIRLHNQHFLQALEARDWSDVAAVVDPTYLDQWGQDRTLVLERVREVLRLLRKLRVENHERSIRVAGATGIWVGRILLHADESEFSPGITQRVNKLEEPFEFRWRRASWKPWDWKLVRASNAALELPANGF